jgi:hypothetical protein
VRLGAVDLDREPATDLLAAENRIDAMLELFVSGDVTESSSAAPVAPRLLLGLGDALATGLLLVEGGSELRARTPASSLEGRW